MMARRLAEAGRTSSAKELLSSLQNDYSSCAPEGYIKAILATAAREISGKLIMTMKGVIDDVAIGL